MTSVGGSEAVLGREGRSTTAGCCRVRVADDELRTLQIFLVVNFGAHQILNAHRVNHKRNAPIFNLTVTFFNILVESEAVLESGTTRRPR